MLRLDQLSLATFSERGIDRGLSGGRFNALSSMPVLEFERYWRKEIARFEKRIREHFSSEAVFVSDNVPLGKRFGIEVTGPANSEKVFQCLLDYIEAEHPDSSSVIGSVFESPMPSSGLVVSREGCALDQDALAWFLDRAFVEGVRLANLRQLRETFSAVNIAKEVPCLQGRGSISLTPANFWRMIYAGDKCYPMEGENLEPATGYELGGEIVSRLYDRLRTLGHVDEDTLFISSALPRHRVLKIECARNILDANLLTEVEDVVIGFHETWGVRFSVFENLLEPNCYLGGVLITPTRNTFLEGGK
jgi:hypothetical protein